MKLRSVLVGSAATYAAVALVVLIWTHRDRFTPLDAGSAAPDYAAFSLDGDTVTLASYRGDVVLLNIWATWCGPCVREMPALERLHEALGDQGLSIVAVSVDQDRGPDESGRIRAFVDRFALTFPVLHDPSGDIQSLYQVNALPTTFIIDRDGTILRKKLGAAEWDLPPLSDEIRRMLEG